MADMEEHHTEDDATLHAPPSSTGIMWHSNSQLELAMANTMKSTVVGIFQTAKSRPAVPLPAPAPVIPQQERKEEVEELYDSMVEPVHVESTTLDEPSISADSRSVAAASKHLAFDSVPVAPLAPSPRMLGFQALTSTPSHTSSSSRRAAPLKGGASSRARSIISAAGDGEVATDGFSSWETSNTSSRRESTAEPLPVALAITNSSTLPTHLLSAETKLAADRDRRPGTLGTGVHASPLASPIRQRFFGPGSGLRKSSLRADPFSPSHGPAANDIDEKHSNDHHAAVPSRPAQAQVQVNTLSFATLTSDSPVAPAASTAEADEVAPLAHQTNRTPSTKVLHERTPSFKGAHERAPSLVVQSVPPPSNGPVAPAAETDQPAPIHHALQAISLPKPAVRVRALAARLDLALGLEKEDRPAPKIISPSLAFAMASAPIPPVSHSVHDAAAEATPRPRLRGPPKHFHGPQQGGVYHQQSLGLARVQAAENADASPLMQVRSPSHGIVPQQMQREPEPPPRQRSRPSTRERSIERSSVTPSTSSEHPAATGASNWSTAATPARSRGTSAAAVMDRTVETDAATSSSAPTPAPHILPPPVSDPLAAVHALLQSPSKAPVTKRGVAGRVTGAASTAGSSGATATAAREISPSRSTFSLRIPTGPLIAPVPSTTRYSLAPSAKDAEYATIVRPPVREPVDRTNERELDTPDLLSQSPAGVLSTSEARTLDATWHSRSGFIRMQDGSVATTPSTQGAVGATRLKPSPSSRITDTSDVEFIRPTHRPGSASSATSTNSNSANATVGAGASASTTKLLAIPSQSTVPLSPPTITYAPSSALIALEPSLNPPGSTASLHTQSTSSVLVSNASTATIGAGSNNEPWSSPRGYHLRPQSPSSRSAAVLLEGAEIETIHTPAPQQQQHAAATATGRRGQQPAATAADVQAVIRAYIPHTLPSTHHLSSREDALAIGSRARQGQQSFQPTMALPPSLTKEHQHGIDPFFRAIDPLAGRKAGTNPNVNHDSGHARFNGPQAAMIYTIRGPEGRLRKNVPPGAVNGASGVSHAAVSDASIYSSLSSAKSFKQLHEERAANTVATTRSAASRPSKSSEQRSRAMAEAATLAPRSIVGAGTAGGEEEKSSLPSGSGAEDWRRVLGLSGERVPSRPGTSGQTAFTAAALAAYRQDARFDVSVDHSEEVGQIWKFMNEEEKLDHLLRQHAGVSLQEVMRQRPPTREATEVLGGESEVFDGFDSMHSFISARESVSRGNVPVLEVRPQSTSTNVARWGFTGQAAADIAQAERLAVSEQAMGVQPRGRSALGRKTAQGRSHRGMEVEPEEMRAVHTAGLEEQRMVPAEGAMSMQQQLQPHQPQQSLQQLILHPKREVLHPGDVSFVRSTRGTAGSLAQTDSIRRALISRAEQVLEKVNSGVATMSARQRETVRQRAQREATELSFGDASVAYAASSQSARSHSSTAPCIPRALPTHSYTPRLASSRLTGSIDQARKRAGHGGVWSMDPRPRATSVESKDAQAQTQAASGGGGSGASYASKAFGASSAQRSFNHAKEHLDQSLSHQRDLDQLLRMLDSDFQPATASHVHGGAREYSPKKGARGRPQVFSWHHQPGAAGGAGVPTDSGDSSPVKEKDVDVHSDYLSRLTRHRNETEIDAFDVEYLASIEERHIEHINERLQMDLQVKLLEAEELAHQQKLKEREDRRSKAIAKKRESILT